LGGIGPKDEVNPDYPHISTKELANILLSDVWQLMPRLPIYPQYEGWLSPILQANYYKWQLTIK
jgi:7,8-didemethyl-8-hydroxy-5-deazariboflavin synthase